MQPRHLQPLRQDHLVRLRHARRHGAGPRARAAALHLPLTPAVGTWVGRPSGGLATGQAAGPVPRVQRSPVLRWTPVSGPAGLSLLHPETGESVFGIARIVAVTCGDGTGSAG